MSDAADQRTAVVMITRNRREEAVATAFRLRALPERPRLVVVDNGSADDTPAAIRSACPDIEVIALARNAGAAARNIAVRLLDTPYVAFSDDDSWWAPGSLRRAAGLLDAHPRLAVVNARILVGDDCRTDAISEEMAGSPLPRVPGLPGSPLLSFLAGASVLRRRAFLDVGGFEPRLLIGGEEELLAADLAARGWSLAYVPEIVCHHHPSRRRDPAGRRRLGIRNTLWFTWLRRPLPSALAHTVSLLRRLPLEPTAVAAVADAARGLPWVLRNRRVLPAHVEQGLRLLAPSQRSSEARQYVS